MVEIRDSDLPPLVGTWRNTDEKSAWIQEFTVVAGDDPDRGEAIGYMQVTAASPPTDWGRAPLESFTFKPGERAFRARFEVSGMTCDLTAYSNLGLIVIAAYIDFDDADKGGHLCREFYVPAHNLESP